RSSAEADPGRDSTEQRVDPPALLRRPHDRVAGPADRAAGAAAGADPRPGDPAGERQRRGRGRGRPGRTGRRADRDRGDRAVVSVALPPGRTVLRTAGRGLSRQSAPVAARPAKPASPTAIRHQANGAKPWRLTKSSRNRTTTRAVRKATTKPITIRPASLKSSRSQLFRRS